MTKKPIILYHANCLDGTGSKFAAWKEFGENGAHYVPVQYGQDIPKCVDYTTGENVYMLDFSYPREVLERLRGQHTFVKIIDHHKTAEKDLTGLEDCTFDMSKSGAVLSWEYFHPGVEIPEVLLYVQDRDLWQWKMTGTKDVTAGLSLFEGDMEKWDATVKLGATGTDAARETGYAINQYIDAKVTSATKPERVKLVNFMGKKLGILNSTGYSSEVCQEIYSKFPVDLAISYFIEVDGTVVLSFRSNSIGGVGCDVSEIAKTFGGGGHKHAAGGRTDLATLQIIINGEYK
jgi:oligoribonuclease NrnB/cAMP/cGMP phosphodiesterase (DHH superfamily)